MHFYILIVINIGWTGDDGEKKETNDEALRKGEEKEEKGHISKE